MYSLMASSSEEAADTPIDYGQLAKPMNDRVHPASTAYHILLHEGRSQLA
jgi:hypothetical protein